MSKHRGRKCKVTYIVFIVIIILSYFLGYQGKKMLQEEVVYITPKDQTHKEDLFTLGEVQKLEGLYPKLGLSYRYETTATLKKDNRECLVRLIYTNENDRKWNKIFLQEGSFLVDHSYNKKQLVIDEKVAFKLLGSSSSVGRDILLNNNKLYIKGVIKQGLLRKWYYDKNTIIGEAYVSGESQESKDMLLKGLVVSGLSGEKLQDKGIVEGLLGAIGKNKELYNVISLTHYSYQISDYMKVIRSSFILMVIIVVWKKLKERMYEVCKQIVSGLKKDYFKQYIKKNKLYLLKEMTLAVISLILTLTIGIYFICSILWVVTGAKVRVMGIEQLPDTIRLLSMMNIGAISLLIISEVFFMYYLITVWKQKNLLPSSF